MVDDRTALMSARALNPGYEVLWYTIDRVLGQGGFGITYLAHDRNLDRAVAIKEYLPTSFAYRHQDYSVKPITGDHKDNFVWGLGSFLKEAQTLARFSHPNIVRVHSVFEENSTAYMVMEYEHGQNLATLYKQRKDLDQAFFQKVFFPIFDGLKEIHKFDFIHRDIKPANIYIREDGTPVLIDFGSARQTTQQQTSEMTTLVSQGYTPLEQYSANYGDQGPWTDIYALAASMYEGIVGRKPDESLSRSACLMRSKPDLLEALDSQIYTGFSQRFLNAILAGLKLEPEGRPQSLEQWYQLFEQGSDTFPFLPEGSGFTELDSDRTRVQPRGPRSVQSPPVSPPESRTETRSEWASERRPSERPSERPSDRPERSQTYPSGDLYGSDPGVPLDDFDSFTELDSARFTAPRSDSQRLSDNSSAQQWTQQSHVQQDAPSSTSRPARARVVTARLADDELLAFTDDELVTDSRRRTRYVATPSPARVGKANRNPGVRLIAGLAVLLLLGAGGAWFLYDNRTQTSPLTPVVLEGMPRPSQTTSTVLPEESVRSQLSDMARLAPLLTEAYRIDPDDPTLLDTIRATESALLSLARTWNASQHAEVGRLISEVSSALPAAAHDRDRLQGILAASAQVSSFSQVMALLDDERYLLPAGDSVLDRITSVSASDYQRLRSSEQWQKMMTTFSETAVQKLSESRFDDVARLTEAALTLDAQDSGFQALRSFLAGS